MGSRDMSVVVSLGVLVLSVAVVLLLPGEHQTFMQQCLGKLRAQVADISNNVSGAPAGQEVRQPDLATSPEISQPPALGLADKVAACKLSGQVRLGDICPMACPSSLHGCMGLSQCQGCAQPCGSQHNPPCCSVHVASLEYAWLVQCTCDST